MKEISAQLNGDGLRVGIVVARFNDFLTQQLLGGARDCFVRHGVADDDITAVWVPGSNEAPLAAEQLARQGGLDAIVALGCIVEGATPHAGLIAGQVERSLASIASAHALPVINGVLLTHTLEQAIERCGTKAGNRGWAAAQAAIEMANLFKRLGSAGR